MVHIVLLPVTIDCFRTWARTTLEYHPHATSYTAYQHYTAIIPYATKEVHLQLFIYLFFPMTPDGEASVIIRLSYLVLPLVIRIEKIPINELCVSFDIKFNFKFKSNNFPSFLPKNTKSWFRMASIVGVSNMY